MNIRDLKYFTAIAKYEHFGQAAKASFISQPALSMQIKKLEDELGIKLFERSNKKVFITPVGQKLLEKAKEILLITNDMVNIADNFHDPFTGQIKIAAFPTLAPYFLPLVIPKIAKSFPKLKLLLVEEKTEIIINQLNEGIIDVALLAMPLPVDNSAFVVENLFEEEFYLALPKGHRLSGYDYINNEDIKDEDLLLLSEGHCLRDQALEVCSMLGVMEKGDFKATSLETLRQMVAAGVGITLIPKLAIKTDQNIKYIPFAKPSPMRTIAMVYRKSSTKMEVIDKIGRYLVGPYA